MANKRKTTTAIVAGVTAVALLLGGTFAWTSISQQAKNEAIVDINPGGRLHDDFNGTNKDVYVENFGDEKTGVPIFARIRLYEYMEIGQQAGDKSIADDERKAESLIDGDTISDTAEWEIYKYGETSDFTKYWSWKLGRTETDGDLPYYMPTFNMNKDSLAADINGTYEGKLEGDIVHYDDYVLYGPDGTETLKGTEIYDWDEDTIDEDEESEYNNGGITTDNTTPIDSADVYHKSNATDENGNQLVDADGNPVALTHTAKQLSTTSTVMSMADWIADGSQPGNFWVFDTDGWAYWANPILPGETTGLLLDSIEMIRVPDDSWYYGINVVAQFATAGDIQAFNSGKTNDETWTSDAEELFAKITKTETVAIDGFDRIAAGSTVAFDATRMVAGTAAANQPTFTWTATDSEGAAIEGVSIDDGKLSVADTVADGTEVTITAMIGDGTATADEETTVVKMTKVVTVSVYPELAPDLTLSGSASGATISTEGDVVTITTDAFKYAANAVHKIKLNRNIDLEKSLADSYTNTGNYDISVTKSADTAEADTLLVRLSKDNKKAIKEYITLDGIDTPVIRLKLYTDSGEICVIMPLQMVQTDAYITNLVYLRGEDDWDNKVSIKEGVELQHGDILRGYDSLLASLTRFGIRVYFYDENGNMLDDYSVNGRLKVTATEDREVTLRMVRNVGDSSIGETVCNEKFYYRDTKVTIKGNPDAATVDATSDEELPITIIPQSDDAS